MFALELGMRVVAVLSPVKTRNFRGEVRDVAGNVVVFEDADLYTLRKFVEKNPVHLLIGDCRGRYVGDIPLLRVGFPVYDRFGYHRKPMLGYGGALRMANLILERSESEKPVAQEIQSEG